MKLTSSKLEIKIHSTPVRTHFKITKILYLPYRCHTVRVTLDKTIG